MSVCEKGFRFSRKMFTKVQQVGSTRSYYCNLWSSLNLLRFLAENYFTAKSFFSTSAFQYPIKCSKKFVTSSSLKYSSEENDQLVEQLISTRNHSVKSLETNQ